MRKTGFILVLISFISLRSQVGFDNRNWLIGRYYGTITKVVLPYNTSNTCAAGLDIIKLSADTCHLFMQDSSCIRPYWGATDGYCNALVVTNDSSMKYVNLNQILGKLYFNDSLHLDYYNGGSVPYTLSYRMKKVRAYWGGCFMLNQSSAIPCNSLTSTVSFTVDPLAVQPLSFTVQTPAICSSSYTSSSSSTNPSLTLNCSGVNTIVVRDGNNGSLGNFTHTVIQDTTIDPGISSSSNTICIGESLTLGINAVGGSYTINPISWSEGSTTSSILVSPTVTTTYSVSGVYTASSKTCTAQSTKTIVVNACIGINELEILQSIELLPNPVNDRLYIQNPMNIVIKGLRLQSIEGKEILVFDRESKIDVTSIPEGLYFLQIQTKVGVLTKKIIIQH